MNLKVSVRQGGHWQEASELSVNSEICNPNKRCQQCRWEEMCVSNSLAQFYMQCQRTSGNQRDDFC